MRNLPLAIRMASLGEDLRYATPLAQRLGYRGAQLELHQGSLDLRALSASGRRDLRHLLASHELEIASLRTPTLGDAPLHQPDHALWNLRQAMEAAAGLQAATLCVELGPLPRPEGPTLPATPLSPAQAGLLIIPEPVKVAPPAPMDPKDQQAWAALDLLLREVGQLADHLNLPLAFTSELADFASLLRAVMGANCPWFAIELDTAATLCDSWDLSRLISETGPLIRQLRCRDALRGSQGRTQPVMIGRGHVDWPQLFSLLNEGGYSGWAIVDTLDLPDRLTPARQAPAVLKHLAFHN